MTRFDYLLVGGGLQNGLIALALAAARPSAAVALVERANRLGGNHTWSLHAADLPRPVRRPAAALVTASWPAHVVRFPGFTRVLSRPYASVTADRFDAVVRDAFRGRRWHLRCDAEAAEVTAGRVVLKDGDVLTGTCVIDSRGPAGDPGRCGYQKFVGLEVEADRDWPEPLPLVMDARVEQEDGFRFVYVLPLTPRRVLVEDTVFSDRPHLDVGHFRRRVRGYLDDAEVGVRRVLRQESGVLPMPWGPPPEWVVDGVIRGGYAGGWLHPATGYSFPAAARLAAAVASTPPHRAERAARAAAARLRPRQDFGRLLNWLAFRLIRPGQRWKLFRRFYRALSEDTIGRFYGLRSHAADAARILIGRPPAGVSLSRLLAAAEVTV